LLQAAKQRPATQISAYMRALKDFVNYFERTIVETNLRPLKAAPPLIELFVFTDTTTARQHLLGTPRASIHTALNNPGYYLQCQCCDIAQNTLKLLPTMPALSVAYKLHLECGKIINLFDWLQAFKTVIANKSVDDEVDGYDVVDPCIQ
jgi:origin recognition complex subunit 3